MTTWRIIVKNKARYLDILAWINDNTSAIEPREGDFTLFKADDMNAFRTWARANKLRPGRDYQTI